MSGCWSPVLCQLLGLPLLCVAVVVSYSTDNAVKNHWYSTMRRSMRRIAKKLKQQQAVSQKNKQRAAAAHAARVAAAAGTHAAAAALSSTDASASASAAASYDATDPGAYVGRGVCWAVCAGVVLTCHARLCSLTDVVQNLKSTDQALFMRCFSLLQNSLTGLSEDGSHAHRLPASSVPAGLSQTLKSLDAVKTKGAGKAPSTRATGGKRKRRDLSITVEEPPASAPMNGAASAAPAAAAGNGAAAAAGAGGVGVPDTPRRRLHTQMLLRLLSQARNTPTAASAAAAAAAAGHAPASSTGMAAAAATQQPAPRKRRRKTVPAPGSTAPPASSGAVFSGLPASDPVSALMSGADSLRPEQLQQVRGMLWCGVFCCAILWCGVVWYGDSALLAVVVHLPMPCLACPVQLAVQAGVVPASTPVEAVQSLLTPRSSAIAAAGGGGGRHFDFSMPPPSDMPPTPSLDLDANDIAEFFSMPSPYPRHADGFAFPYVLPAWLQDVGRTLT